MDTIKMSLGELEWGFFLYGSKLYFGSLKESWVIYFPVVNGKISRYSDSIAIHPGETIEVIASFEELSKYGINIKPGDDLNADRFWSPREQL